MTIGFTPEQRAMLDKKLDSNRVSDRKGRGGKSFDYLEAWDVQDRANQVFGFDGWSQETVILKEVYSGYREDRDGREKFCVSYLAKVRVTVYAGDRILMREGTGYGDGEDLAPGAAHELAAKESESDALKRALKSFGNQFGLALYDKERRNVQEGSDDEPLEVPDKVLLERERQEMDAAPNKVQDDDFPGDRPSPGAIEIEPIPLPDLAKDAPRELVETRWRGWSRKLMKAVGDAGSRDVALEIAKANAQGIVLFTKASGSDALKLVHAKIDKMYPDNRAHEEADKAQSLVWIEPPESEHATGWTKWRYTLGKLLDDAETPREEEEILSANAYAIEVGSRAMKMDLKEWARMRIKDNARRSEGRGR
jgi:DNA recombination protein Rad52